MDASLQDWIRHLGQISGDARQVLLRTACELRWGLAEFADQVIYASVAPPPIADHLTAFELAAVRRAFYVDFFANQEELDSLPQNALTSSLPSNAPSWDMLNAEAQRAHEPLMQNMWPPPVGHPSWGEADGMHFVDRPPPQARSGRNVTGASARIRSSTPDRHPSFRRAQRMPPKSPRHMHTAAVMSTFDCGPVSPRSAAQAVRGDEHGAYYPHNVMGRRPHSAPHGRKQPRVRRSVSPSRVRHQEPFKIPSAGRRCSGSSPWWKQTAWTVFPPFEAEPWDRDRQSTAEWLRFARRSAAVRATSSRPWGFEQEWAPDVAVYGKRVSMSRRAESPFARHWPRQRD